MHRRTGREGKVRTARCKRVALTNHNSRADLSRAKRYLGYEPEFKLQDALKDLTDWMRRYLA